jgi:flavin-dependent dehydrogenase
MPKQLPMPAPGHIQKSVIIMGGGLAGLSLAIQLKQKHPFLPITVLEKNSHPVAHATHKVGESTVEIGAHYFAQVLGFKAHLDNEQLKKFGFRFFFSDRRSSIDDVTELGGSMTMPKGAYQIDRGVFENFLGEQAHLLGVNFLSGATIRGFEMKVATDSADSAQATLHRVTFEHLGSVHTLATDWLIDATGRAGLIKRRRKLAQINDHNANAVWFRINRKIDVNTWSDDQVWLKRCDPPNRWLSTNHLVGDGYWVWLIPLASGSHSVGIVCDAMTHPIEGMNTFEKTMTWLAQHQPRLHTELKFGQCEDHSANIVTSVQNGAVESADYVQDFAFFKRFSYGCSQVYSGDERWALTGEAGVFLDPFYSPGSDFIAIGNGFITQLITLDIEGKRLSASAEIFQKIFLNFYQNMLPIYVNQYKLFADPEILPLKLSWDYGFYWSLMCQMYMQNKLTDLPVMFAISPILERAQILNIKMQTLFGQWGDLNHHKNPALMLDQCKVGWLYELNKAMTEKWDDQLFIENIKKAGELLEVLAAQISGYAKKTCPSVSISDIELNLASAAIDPFGAHHPNMIFSNMQA